MRWLLTPEKSPREIKEKEVDIPIEATNDGGNIFCDCPWCEERRLTIWTQGKPLCIWLKKGRFYCFNCAELGIAAPLEQPF